MKTIEGEEAISILYACESGSRAWDFASTDSDYDVRFIYVRDVSRYLHLSRPRDVIERPLTDNLDVNGWDVFKACELLRKSNPPLLEWFGSPIVYGEHGDFARTCRVLADEHFCARACCEHYLSLAKSTNALHVADQARIKRKKYLYVLRPLIGIRWIVKYGAFPPTSFPQTLAGLEIPREAAEEIDLLLRDKRAGVEMDEAPANQVLGAFITQELNRLTPIIRAMPPRPFPQDSLNQLLERTILTASV